MTDIFISKGKGPSKKETPRRSAPEIGEHLSCVGVRNEQHEPGNLPPSYLSPPSARVTVDAHTRATEPRRDVSAAAPACGAPAARDPPRAAEPHAEGSRSGVSETSADAILDDAHGQPPLVTPNASLLADFEAMADDRSGDRRADVTTERDTDFVAASWDQETGEFVRSPTRPARFDINASVVRVESVRATDARLTPSIKRST